MQKQFQHAAKGFYLKKKWEYFFDLLQCNGTFMNNKENKKKIEKKNGGGTYNELIMLYMIL